MHNILVKIPDLVYAEHLTGREWPLNSPHPETSIIMLKFSNHREAIKNLISYKRMLHEK